MHFFRENFPTVYRIVITITFSIILNDVKVLRLPIDTQVMMSFDLDLKMPSIFDTVLEISRCAGRRHPGLGILLVRLGIKSDRPQLYTSIQKEEVTSYSYCQTL